MGPKTLHVRAVTSEQISKGWGIDRLPMCITPGQQSYARCNVNGTINWEKTCIYTQKEIEAKPKVKILLKETVTLKTSL